MWQKAFHVVLVTFLVVFTAAVLVLLVSGVSMFIFPSERNGVFAISRGVSIPALKFIGLLILFSSLVVISLVARRRRLH